MAKKPPNSRIAPAAETPCCGAKSLSLSEALGLAQKLQAMGIEVRLTSPAGILVWPENGGLIVRRPGWSSLFGASRADLEGSTRWGLQWRRPEGGSWKGLASLRRGFPGLEG